MVSNTNIMLLLIAIAAGLVLVAMYLGSQIMRRSRRLAQSARFKQRWQEIQRKCANSELWPMCIIDADKLLDEALKAAGYKGKTMGERLVSAQRDLSDNDGVWYGHKLRNKIVHEDTPKLVKKDVQAALHGMRQALLDVGAL